MNIDPLSGWAPIDSAPRDGTKVMAMLEDARPGSPATFVYFKDGSWWADDVGVLGERTFPVRPTHYFPLAEIAAVLLASGVQPMSPGEFMLP
jgi:hypothetical protein